MLRNQFTDRLKAAQHAKDEPTVSTLRLIIAAMKDRDIAARSKGNWDGIKDDEIMAMMASMIKQRHESIKMYELGKRPELAEREATEIRIIESFMPKQLTEPEVKAVIDTLVKDMGASGLKDMGRVMAEMKTKYAGQLDFSKASGWVKEKLTE
ncbi:MAG TPA: GatB/YqeY domain-containing protein [Patescibacteria group bacterium]|nr:GatB/YqeY domain-containing protein [Patescibacteria group bacterium]